MSATRKLRLGPLPKTESIKLTFACPASLKADLDRYAELHAQAYGEEVDAMTLIPHMLEAFMAGDRGFAAESPRVRPSRKQELFRSATKFARTDDLVVPSGRPLRSALHWEGGTVEAYCRQAPAMLLHPRATYQVCHSQQCRNRGGMPGLSVTISCLSKLGLRIVVVQKPELTLIVSNRRLEGVTMAELMSKSLQT